MMLPLWIKLVFERHHRYLYVKYNEEATRKRARVPLTAP